MVLAETWFVYNFFDKNQENENKKIQLPLFEAVKGFSQNYFFFFFFLAFFLAFFFLAFFFFFAIALHLF
ncbi:hypothetical protein KY338_03120 [Candidatus Woesearchaeota archaeon]|nr:hypothetical protein [Candidatus Woesearchaeota archaeon]MBW3005656.1 hypothetical protein [Candidatus Woesearchaeota archaeon]